jgi:tRNA nucleotidyltransferase (CCA-adding enzyme)
MSGIEIGKTHKFNIFPVGGCVRDDFLGLRSKDVDFTAVGISDDVKAMEVGGAFKALHDALEEEGFTIFLEQAEFATIRAKFPEDTSSFHFPGIKTVDFVLARKEGPYSDGRRPDWVKVGTLEDDLRRRDFTINALAKRADGTVIDLFGGMEDLKNKNLRFVGEPQDRIREDALRIMRAVRFTVTKGFRMDDATRKAICSPTSIALLRMISEERRAAELDSMFAFSTMTALDVIGGLPRPLVDSMFSGRVRLNATLKKEKRR